MRRKAAEMGTRQDPSILHALDRRQREGLLRIVEPATLQHRLWAQMICTGCTSAVHSNACGDGQDPLPPSRSAGSSVASTPSRPSRLTEQPAYCPPPPAALPPNHVFGQVTSLNKYWHAPLHNVPIRGAHTAHPYS
eukprot:TRINITY_DN3348_c1_g1_i1.p2 TRINITY_DN3348_c1_g1~~TRINITY_DN3348_c1_g1_i1.p2  ORF type:complete len:136 (+),score=36.86 TRINITY_DN3348_c1_g1_i1:1-408(+)